MKPRTWAAIVGGALTIMIGAALVIAEDHEDHFSGVDATTTVPVVIETSTTAAVETTTTTAPPAYGVVWHTGYNTSVQESIAVSDGLIYHAHRDGGIRVIPMDRVDFFDYYPPDEGRNRPNFIHIYIGSPHHDEKAIVRMARVSDLAGLVDELEEELGD